MAEPVEAVRVGIGDFILAAEQVHIGLQFRAGDKTYEVVSEPRLIGADRFSAQVRDVGTSGQFGAFLRVGHRVT